MALWSATAPAANAEGAGHYCFHSASRGFAPIQHVARAGSGTAKFFVLSSFHGSRAGAVSGCRGLSCATASQTDSPTLSDAELRRFLKAFNRSHPTGRRDFAMALCLCRLGMRAQEVASLRLADVDYHTRTLHLRLTKTRQGRLLPLPAELAKAIRAYVRSGRPASDSPVLFVRHRAPWTAGRRSELVRTAMRSAYLRAKLIPRGVHILRHTLATRLHRRGVGLKAIADVLGHRSLDTTARYARINHAELGQAALPWPRG